MKNTEKVYISIVELILESFLQNMSLKYDFYNNNGKSASSKMRK